MLYVDTSASVKLLLDEAESGALREYLEASGMLLSTSRVGVIELRRVGRRSGAGADRADAVAATLAVIEVEEVIERTAVTLNPGLRTLDAIHLASALAAEESLGGFVCYDERLSAAARDAGLTVIAPGR
ncbi:MAG TPA: type II toxin-antitoxin system VapC family toxin [Gaiellaceae bacterium]|nr:type II toxin-antitoxin system VapC family toxin [Gaiellaceae bacterium]